MENGWVKLHRKLLENPIIRKPKYLALWVILLLKANHKETKMIWNNNVIIIKEGQFITGRDQLSKATGIHRSSVERILDLLENEHQIEQEKTTKYRLITILNWKEYQDKSDKTSNKRATNEQQVSTNKNDNNEKKNTEKEESSLSFLKNPSKELVEEMVSRFKCDNSMVITKAHSLVDYCDQKGKKYKNYKSFLSNTLRKDFGERPLKVKQPIYEFDKNNNAMKIVGYK